MLKNHQSCHQAMEEIVPAPAVRLMKRRASSRSGVNCQLLNSKENERDTLRKDMRINAIGRDTALEIPLAWWPQGRSNLLLNTFQESYHSLTFRFPILHVNISFYPTGNEKISSIRKKTNNSIMIYTFVETLKMPSLVSCKHWRRDTFGIITAYLHLHSL